MRAAVSRFIECMSLSKIPLNEKIKKSLLDTLNENLKHPNAQIQVYRTQDIYLIVEYSSFPKVLQIDYSLSVIK